MNLSWMNSWNFQPQPLRFSGQERPSREEVLRERALAVGLPEDSDLFDIVGAEQALALGLPITASVAEVEAADLAQQAKDLGLPSESSWADIQNFHQERMRKSLARLAGLPESASDAEIDRAIDSRRLDLEG